MEGDDISKLEDIAEGGCICFYEVLADHYVKSPESARRTLDLIMQLWSQSFVSHIFALLFHKWVRFTMISVIVLLHFVFSGDNWVLELDFDLLRSWLGTAFTSFFFMFWFIFIVVYKSIYLIYMDAHIPTQIIINEYMKKTNIT